MPKAAPILFITGKGGAGKTTVACALAMALAQRGDRVLLVEPSGVGPIGAFPEVVIGGEPIGLAANLDAVQMRPRQLLEDYFRGLLKLPALARRLLSSATFNAVTSAAPGVSEFLILDRLGGYSRAGRYDHLIVDGPATGHALQLLRAPFQLAAIASSGPLHQPLRRLIETLRRPARASVAFVSLCEEMSIAESIEGRGVVAALGIAVQRPLLNRCAEHRFNRDEARQIAALPPEHPVVRAARLHVAAQQRTAAFASTLKKAFGTATLPLRESERAATSADALVELGSTILRGLRL